MRTCEECSAPFNPRRFWQKFCSRECSTRDYWRRKLADIEKKVEVENDAKQQT